MNDRQHQQLPPAQRAGEFCRAVWPETEAAEWIELQSDAAGEAVIEVFSQRLGEPTDPFLTISQVVKNEQGEESLKQIAEADRGEERPATPGYNITSEDPYVRLNLEKDAVYRIMVRDQNFVLARRPEPCVSACRSPPAARFSIACVASLALGGRSQHSTPLAAHGARRRCSGDSCRRCAAGRFRERYRRYRRRLACRRAL